ncbi:flagellar biosynthetic protein FliR [Aquicoccus sp. G2-2]|uniref:flagellar biosynthetic protein FliR n=1 Tax=Aquicoccus sp. G2-2 TaxID=3092120 RepID=UPI002AE00A32|nr:flagellar biosynthetic protein FliR [Aquicoccus sp. G2-2]MEA1114396.1 flagellar biosynthetic protein FliR [Aquicoccus sp. G2-2]
MTADLAQLLGLSQALLWQGFVVFLRVGGMMALLPAFGERSVPVRVRLVLTLAFTAVTAPAAPPAPAPDDAGLIALLFCETGTGLVLGIGLRLFILGLQTAGSIAAQATSLAQIFGGAATEPMPAMGHMLVISALALSVMSGLHVRVAEMLILSYRLFPMGGLPAASALSQWGVARVSAAFSLGFTLAAPFLIISVLYNLTLGVINRAMPQLMVAFVGAPLITAGGLFLLFLFIPIMLSHWNEALFTFIANPFGQAP